MEERGQGGGSACIYDRGDTFAAIVEAGKQSGTRLFVRYRLPAMYINFKNRPLCHTVGWA